MSDGEKLGLATAVAVAREAMAEDLDDALEPAEQLALPGVKGAAAEAGGEVGGQPAEPSGPRGPGRPPGARNKRTDKLVEYIMANHKSPLVWLAEQYTQDPVELARRLQCKPIEAYKLQVVAAKELAPYTNQKRPVAVEVDQKGVVQLVIETGGVPAPVAQMGDDSVVIEGQAVEVESDEKSDG